MTRRETRFTNILRSRGIGFILALTGAWMVLRCSVACESSGVSGLPAPLNALATPGAVSIVNILGIILTAVALVVLNRTYNLLKTLSVFFAAYFIFTTCATPGVLTEVSASVPLAFIMVFATWLLFSVYNKSISDRRIFLIFCLLSAGTLFSWTFLFFVPVFIIGLAQMKILRVKKIAAAIIGLLTPPWIVWGLQLMPLPSIPHIYFTSPALIWEDTSAVPFFATVAFTLLVGFTTGMINLVRILGFNARARSFNSFIALLGVTTGLLAIINFTALSTYVTLLNACVAMQVGHFFRATASRRGYIAVLILLGAYAALYSWATTV